MSKKQANYQEICSRYAKAIFSFCKNTSDLENYKSDFTRVISLKEENLHFSNFLINPLISSQKKIDILEKISKKIKLNKIFSNFLKTLAKHNRLFAIDTIFDLFKSMIQDQNNETRVEVISIKPLSQEIKENLEQKFQKLTKRKIKIFNNIDKNILGGIIIKIDSLMIDSSVKTKLDKYQFLGKGLS